MWERRRHRSPPPPVSSGYGDNGAGVLQLGSRIGLLQGALQVDERWSSCFIRGRKSQDFVRGQLSRSVASFTIFIDRAPPRVWECMECTLISWVSTRRSYDGCAKSLNLHAIQHHSSITKAVTMLHRLLPFKLTRRTHSASSVVSRYSDLTTADGAGRQSHLQSVELYFEF